MGICSRILDVSNSAERPSPSSPNLQADNHKGAGEGLDVTACSASSLFDRIKEWYDNGGWQIEHVITGWVIGAALGVGIILIIKSLTE